MGAIELFPLRVTAARNGQSEMKRRYSAYKLAFGRLPFLNRRFIIRGVMQRLILPSVIAPVSEQRLERLA
jgi:hypothetical protein